MRDNSDKNFGESCKDIDATFSHVSLVPVTESRVTLLSYFHGPLRRRTRPTNVRITQRQGSSARTHPRKVKMRNDHVTARGVSL